MKRLLILLPLLLVVGCGTNTFNAKVQAKTVYQNEYRILLDNSYSMVNSDKNVYDSVEVGGYYRFDGTYPGDGSPFWVRKAEPLK